METVENQLEAELEALPSRERSRLEPLLVEPYRIPVESTPGETVVVVGSSQLALRHAAWQLLQEPDARR